MTTIAIAIQNMAGYKLVTINEGDPEIIGQTLKEYYNTPETINALLDNGNIATLGNTIEESTFTGDPVTSYETIDGRESEITIMDKNFFFIDNKWLIRNFGEEYYLDV